ncbi:MAG: hypothetical protein WC343_08620 [Bacilli bacterium]|jgi:hypothetical protein
MDKHTFRIRVAQAGYSQEEATRIESILRRTASIPVSREELRDAAFEYLVICTDVDKLLAYLRDVDNLSRGRCISWGAAADIVSHIVAQWWGGKKMTEKLHQKNAKVPDWGEPQQSIRGDGVIPPQTELKLDGEFSQITRMVIREEKR